MNVLTFSQARAGLKQTMDDVCRDHEAGRHQPASVVNT